MPTLMSGLGVGHVLKSLALIDLALASVLGPLALLTSLVLMHSFMGESSRERNDEWAK